MGERKFGSLDKFMEKYGEDWTDYIKKAYKTCRINARKIANEKSRITTAKLEIVKAMYANESSSHFYGETDYNDAEMREYYKAIYDSLEHYSLSVDSVIFMDVKNEYS